MRKVVCCVLLACLATGVYCSDARAVPDPVPRIAIVGDSWGMFMWWFRSLKRGLEDFGYDHYVEMANESVVGGGKTFEFVNVQQFPAAADIRAAIMKMLTDNPTIDIVVISLGGNDILYGTEYVLPDDPLQQVRMQCPGTPNEHNAVLGDKVVNQDMGNIVDYILGIRPDIRILLSSYDYGGDSKRGECDLGTQQQGIMAVDILKQRLAESRGSRVSFINNYGLMQFTYGTYDYQVDSGNNPIESTATLLYPAGYVKPGYDASDYPPLRLPEPDNILQLPWTVGGQPALVPGFPDHFSPIFSLLDKNMHLTEDGYYHMAHRMVERVIGPWLQYPKAFEILPLDTKNAQYQFQVTFSQPVTGVDVSDFEVATATIGGTKSLDISNAQVIAVTPASGFNAVYTVTVDLNPGLKDDNTTQDVVHIHVLDDDTIVDAAGNPLGGPNTPDFPENGVFTFYGPFAFADLATPDGNDFDQVFNYLAVITNPYLPFINYAFSFEPDKFDLNGNITPLAQKLMGGGDIDVNTLYIKGNGMRESYEFGLIERCAKDASIDLRARGGVTHDMVAAAWTHNLAQVRADLGGAVTPTHDNMVLRVLAGLDSVMAGYMTLGEQNTIALLTVASVALQSESVTQFMPGITFSTIAQGNYTLLNSYFGATDKNGDGVYSPNEYADADRDGFTNAEEYLYFECDGKDAFVAAALDPNIKPKALRPYYLIGDSVRVYVPELLHVFKTTYQWYKDGVALVDDDRTKGSNTRTLNIATLAEADSGAYTCTYNEHNPDAPADVTYGPVSFSVVTEIPAEGEGEGEGASEGEGEGEGEGSEGEGEGASEGEGEGEPVVDFCAIMNSIVATANSATFAPILAMLGDQASLINLLECATADLNGPFVDTTQPPDGKPDMPGPNGLLDGQYELGVVAELLNHPEKYTGLASGTLPGQVKAGVDVNALKTAFDANYNAMYTPLAPLLPILPTLVQSLTGVTLTADQGAAIEALFPQVLKVLAGYSVLGDSDSLNVVLFLTQALGKYINGMPTTAAAFQTLNGILGPDGDADGDGVTNRQEYDAFASQGAAKYVQAALAPGVNPDHPTGLLDFCAIMDGAVATATSPTFAPILALLGDQASLINLLECATGDLNGPFVDTTQPPDGKPDMPGPNGMLDGQYELGVVAELINFPAKYASLKTGALPGQVTAGVDPDAVKAAFGANYNAMYSPLAPLLPVLPSLVQSLAGITLTADQSTAIQALFPQILKVLAGYSVLGDSDSMNVVLFLTQALGKYINGMPTTAAAFQTLNGILGPDGDADGDGVTNRQEYNAFAAAGSSAYINAALSPLAKPGITEGEIPPPIHSADTNSDNKIELTELLRIIQFFNSGGFHCQAGTEDGYAPGFDGDHTCTPHASDYNTQDWKINLSELLRVIQFYHLGYHLCVGESTEDGYCPGLAGK
jgi:hypothetical protein